LKRFAVLTAQARFGVRTGRAVAQRPRAFAANRSRQVVFVAGACRTGARVGTFGASQRTSAARTARQIFSRRAVNGGTGSVVKLVSRIAYIARIGGGAGFAPFGAFFGNAFFVHQRIARRTAEAAFFVASRTMFRQTGAAFARFGVFERAAFANAQHARPRRFVEKVSFFALQAGIAVFAFVAMRQA